MARVREFQCDMCRVHEKTTDSNKPEKWVQLKGRSPGSIAGSVRETVLVCPTCDTALGLLTDELEARTQTMVREWGQKDKPTLTPRQVLDIVYGKSLQKMDAVEPNEDEDEDDDGEDEPGPPRRKRKAKKMRREAGAGDGG